MSRWETDSGRFYAENPCVYTGEAVFGVMALFLSEFAPLAERVAAAEQRLAAIPEFLAQAAENLATIPSPWCRQAVDECRGALAFLRRGAAEAAGDSATDSYLQAAGNAAAAFEGFRDFLEKKLQGATEDPVGCGSEALALHLTEGHCLTASADEILTYALTELEKAKIALEAGCEKLGLASTSALFNELAKHRPQSTITTIVIHRPGTTCGTSRSTIGC